jgi:hypothetical protein
MHNKAILYFGKVLKEVAGRKLRTGEIDGMFLELHGD